MAAGDEFDAGINTSAAWTTALETEDEDVVIRPARALYSFDGQEELRELRGVAAGDDLEVIKEDLPDGWSLVRTVADGKLGLLPRSYYTFTADFVHKPDQDCPTPTPRSPANDTVLPQTTGEWLGPLQSIFGGISLNRFSSFVTSGAESWILNGLPDESNPRAHLPPITPDNSAATITSNAEIAEDEDEDDILPGESDRHYIDTGPSWKSKIPPFKILVHSPSKRTSILSGSYTIYNITSIFSPDDTCVPPYTSHHNRLHTDFIPRSAFQTEFPTLHPSNGAEQHEIIAEPEPLQRLTVQRRFSHFITLHNTLTRRLPGLALPPLPAKQYTGRFDSAFIEARRSDLERYLNTLIRHPVVRYAEILTFFLSCDTSSSEFIKLLPKYTALPSAGPQFYARIYHPSYNLDFNDAKEAGEGFAAHIKSVKKSVQGLRSFFKQVREARVEMAKVERGLAYAILGMITAPRQDAQIDEDSEEGEDDRDGGLGGDVNKGNKRKGIVNSSGAWCWRDDCKECLHLTRGLQKISDTLQSVADLYDDHARRTQLATHESLKSMAHPDKIYAPILDTHNATLSRYQVALTDSSDEPSQVELASRCETVLNTTMSEMDIYHTQKVEDFHRLGVEHLDGEIRLYEQILTRLRNARSVVTSPCPSYPTSSETITSSIYTRDLFPSSIPHSPPSVGASSSTSRFYPYASSKLVTTSHKFIPSGVSAAGIGAALGMGEVQISALPMPALHVFD